MRWWVLALLLWLAPAQADEFRPAYLQLTQIDGITYDVLWKVPAIDEARTLKITPVFPPETVVMAPPRMSFAGGTGVLRWTIAVPGGLAGRTISFPDLVVTRIDVLVRLVRADATVQLARVLPGDPQFVVTNSLGRFEVVRTYTALGVEHILGGFDHLLFVLALVLLVPHTRRLVATVTAFTVAHSLTLALASLGVINVPGPPVEAMIALSIMFVAAEILRGGTGPMTRRPWAVAFGFGLLHGLGFAGALAEIGLPEHAIPLALLCFNIGVEIGQLLFIAAVLGAGRLFGRLLPGLNHRRAAAAYGIGGLAGYWVVERVVAFWG